MILELWFIFCKVVQEYRERKAEISRLESDVENRERALSGHQEKIEEIKRQWLDPLRELMEKINENFGYFFSCMKCAGEVDLSVPANEVSDAAIWYTRFVSPTCLKIISL